MEHTVLVPQVLTGCALLTSAKHPGKHAQSALGEAELEQAAGADLKFSAVRGHTSARRVISIRPAGRPPMAISKKTTGLEAIWTGCLSRKSEESLRW